MYNFISRRSKLELDYN